MVINLQLIENYRLPRWEELPDIPLYMDQVILILDQALAPFTQEEKLITPAMINNYVKNGALLAPVKKKYKREHVAALTVMSLMKRVLTINEVVAVMRVLVAQWGVREAYHLFCNRLEEALNEVFIKKTTITFSLDEKEESLLLLEAAIASLMGKLSIQQAVTAWEEAGEKAGEKEKKQHK